MDFKDIHIGSLINKKIVESKIDISRLCNFMKCNEEELNQYITSESLDSNVLLRFSKILSYDFFRLYSQHLIFYKPVASVGEIKTHESSHLPRFRKNIYTKEIITFVLELINTSKKTRKQIIDEYGIPKTTLYKWISKYETPDNEKT